MNKYNLKNIFCFIIFLANISFAQQDVLKKFTPPDSLLRMDYDQLILQYDQLVDAEGNTQNLEVSNAVILSHLMKSIIDSDSVRVARSYERLARINNFSLNYLNECIRYSKNSDHENFPTICFFLKFRKHFENGEYRLASLALNNALPYAHIKNNIDHINYANYGLKMLSRTWGDRKAYLKSEIKLLDSLSLLIGSNKIIPESTIDEYIECIYNVSKVYYVESELSKATFYIDSLYGFAVNRGLTEYIDKYNGLKGAILYKQGAYTEALTYTNTYLNNSIENDNYGISRSSVIKGLILWELQEKELAIASLSTADSLYQITHDEFEELGYGYKTLITYYKEKGDKDKQLEFLNKLIVFDEEITANYLEIAPAITRSYTIPELLSEKEVVIKELSTNNQINEQKKTVYYILLMVASLIIGYFIIQRILFKRRFEKIKKKLEHTENQQIRTKQRSEGQELFELDAKQIERIAKGLERFENERGYINTRLSLKSLATSMDTNSSYLSKYINAIKGVNFSHYVNTLRINAIIEVLQVNAKIRAYTIDAIAEEAGFSNTRSFSNHFKRVTGINPSYFLKQLKKEQNANEVPTPQTV